MISQDRPKGVTSSRKVTPPSPSYMSNEQFASYLADLRNNRITRPGGARPQPDSQRRDSGRTSASNRSSPGGVSLSDTCTPSASVSSSFRTPHAPPSPVGRPSVSASISSRYSTTSSRGRDYFPDKPVVPLKPSEVVPSKTYIERGQRWMEKEEVFSLRQAMDDMDLGGNPEATTPPAEDEEKRLYGAALDEAAELVWRHQNGVQQPQPGAPYRYRQHLRKNSYAHARTASAGFYGEDIAPTGVSRSMGSRSVSGSSASSNESRAKRTRVSLVSGSNSTTTTTAVQRDGGRESLDSSRSSSFDSERSKSHHDLASGPRPVAAASTGQRRRSSLKRNISGEVQKPFSGDQIWEEPEGSTTVESRASASARLDQDAAVKPLRLRQKNPLNRVQFAEETSLPPAAPAPPPEATTVAKLISKIEIHRNPPSQSRNPQYTTNSNLVTPITTTTPTTAAAPPGASIVNDGHGIGGPDRKSPAGPRADVARKNGVEIRSEDIRLATSMRLKDRSEKLPTPSFVSDSPGRPIVSFDANWKAPDTAPADQELDTITLPLRSGAAVASGRLTHPLHEARTEPLSAPSRCPSRQQQVPPGAAFPAVADPQQSPPPPPPPSGRVQLPAIHISEPTDRSASAAVPIVAVTEPPSACGPTPPIISVTCSDPVIPTIVLPSGSDDDDDDGSSGGAGVPVIAMSPAENGPVPVQTLSRRPLPTPDKYAVPARRRGHWSPAAPPPAQVSGSRATARCHECRFPIEGRFVKLAGGDELFHSQCFACYCCGTPLEALEISPEPDTFRQARLERIRARAAGEVLEEAAGQTMGEDGDERLRFYCHLDWHELFAPRCKHCRTPIIGEHVVALGEHFHYGHFFCAECGDPFTEGMTHIEKDGYAWCVSCQTKRTERRAPKCRGCKKAVIGQYVRALGGEWHDECFRCATCGGGFDDGQVFPRESATDGLMQILCTPCRTRELKA